MKQNEYLKRWVRPEGTNMSQLRVAAIIMKPTARKIAGKRLLSILHSRLTAMIKWWKIWGRSSTKSRMSWKEKWWWNLDDMIKRTNSPFTASVLECLLPPKFRLPQLEVYYGTKDPLDHIEAFKTILNLQQTPDEVICRSFPATLKGAARVWFSKLPTSSIANFKQLSDSFVQHFIGGQHNKRSTLYLLTVK